MIPSKSTIQLIFVILAFFITPSYAQNKIKLIAESDSSRYFLIMTTCTKHGQTILQEELFLESQLKATEPVRAMMVL